MSNDISDEEKILFRKSQENTKRLKPYDKIVSQQTKASRHEYQNTEPSEPKTFKQQFEVDKVSSETNLQFQRPGVQPRTIRQLRQGKLPPEAILDLHGNNLIEAEILLDDFLNTALSQNKRIIHIIHGKGHTSKQQFPPLKNMVNQFLHQHSKVLAFSSAPVNNGGTGAVYVLFKKAD